MLTYINVPLSPGQPVLSMTQADPGVFWQDNCEGASTNTMLCSMGYESPVFDIFVSYAREDRRLAEKLASILDENDFSVWWDRKIKPGTLFDLAIDRKLDDARCVLVLWSSHSVNSSWVRREARRGLKKNKLFPVLLENVTPPSKVGRVQAANLAGWTGSAKAPAVRHLINLLDKRLYPASGLYYVPLETVSRYEAAGLPCSGEHLANCLDKSEWIRRTAFMARHGIVNSETGGYLIALRDRYDHHTRTTRTRWVKNPPRF